MKGKCINLDCPGFNKIVEIPDGEDFVCKNPECEHNLQEVTSGSSNVFFPKFKLPLIIAAAILIVAGIMLFFALGGNKPEDVVIPMERIIVE
jgi:hypothetical protein